MLPVILHDDEAADTEGVAAIELHRAPFDLHAHGAGVIVYLGYVGKNLCVYFRTHSFGKVFGEGGVFDLTGEGGLYS